MEYTNQEQLVTGIQTLKENRVRITPQRYAVLEFLIEHKIHPTADEIYRALESKFPNMSVATVYNNLRVFKEVGLVKELTYGDSSSRFDFITDDHYHIICIECGKIMDFHFSDLQDIEEKAESDTGFSIKYHRMELYGYCPMCKGNTSNNTM